MTHVRDFIARNPSNWLSLLEDKFKIHVTRDGDLVSLKYNQIESPMAHPVVRQCRGMVVHAPTGRILAHPYDKFWNHGEPLAAPVNWKRARVQEKLDGSLMILYHDPFAEIWRVASSGHPTAGGTYGVGGAKTFAEMFWQVFEASEMHMPPVPGYCYMFELCAPDNRIVVKYDAPRLVLHGARSLSTGAEGWSLSLACTAAAFHWPFVTEHPVGSLDEAIAKAAELDPLQSEGFVVVDADFNRVKIKSPRYVRLHHLRDKTTPRAIIEAWQKGEESEILAHFPEMEADFLRVLNPIENAAILASNALWEHGSLESRKEFAEHVKHLPYSAVCFRLYGTPRRRPEDALSVLREMSVAALERIVAGMA